MIDGNSWRQRVVAFIAILAFGLLTVSAGGDPRTFAPRWTFEAGG